MQKYSVPAEKAGPLHLSQARHFIRTLGAPENRQLRNNNWKLFGPQGTSAGSFSQGLQLPANQSRDPGNGANRCGRAGSRAFSDSESHTAAASNRQIRPLATTTTERRAVAQSVIGGARRSHVGRAGTMTGIWTTIKAAAPGLGLPGHQQQQQQQLQDIPTLPMPRTAARVETGASTSTSISTGTTTQPHAPSPPSSSSRSLPRPPSSLDARGMSALD